MLFSWQQIEWAGRVLLLAEFALFLFWVICIGIIGFADANVFLSSIASAIHYGATFALYAGIGEIVKAHRRVETGKRDEVEVSLANMWIAVAVVGLVPDIASLMFIVRNRDSPLITTEYWILIVVLNSLFVAMTSLDTAWLLLVRASIAVQNKERLGTSALNMVRRMAVPPPPKELKLELRL